MRMFRRARQTARQTLQGPGSPRTGLEEIHDVWEAQARADPLWAVLSETEKRERAWSVNEFLQTGEDQVARALDRFLEAGGRLPDHELALDFGCGVGRLTQALGRRFQRVIGVDVSETMVAVAKRLAAPGTDVQYVINQQPDLSFVDDGAVSLVFSMITLQHMPTPVALGYLREFLRVVKPGGGLIFQVPSHYADSYLPADRDDEPVSDTARRSETRVLSVPTVLQVGARADLTVAVTNLSDQPWVQSTKYPLNLGNHWINQDDGTVSMHDDGRGRMPGRLHPGETTRVTFTIQAPPTPGLYRIEADVVQEGCAWFASSGGDVGYAEVSVLEAQEEEAAGKGRSSQWTIFEDLIAPSWAEPPPFAMYGIPRPEVEQLVTAHGARILAADEWITEWHSYTYAVQAGG
jgi:SAM-dependent methyltransferase